MSLLRKIKAYEICTAPFETILFYPKKSSSKVISFRFFRAVEIASIPLSAILLFSRLSTNCFKVSRVEIEEESSLSPISPSLFSLKEMFRESKFDIVLRVLERKLTISKLVDMIIV